MYSYSYRVIFVALLLAFTFTHASAQSFSGYHVIKKVVLGGDGGWDYLTVDSDSGRLFISRSTRIMVVDTATGKTVGEIPDTPGVHGIALAPDLNKGFISNGRAGNVTIFELKTLRTLGHATAGKNPDAIIYDPSSQRVFAFNGGSSDATAINAATGEVAGTVALGGKPEFAAADGQGQVFVNLEDKSAVVALDAKSLAVKARWPLAPCEEPSGMAIDRQQHRLFVGCGNQLMAVVDSDSGHVVSTLPIGRGVDANGFDPGSNLAFSSNGDGTLTIVHEDSPSRFTVVSNVPTQRGARTMAVDPKTHNVYLVTAEFGPAPPATTEHPRPRPAILPGTFALLIVGK